MWDALVEGKKPNVASSNHQEALRLYNEIVLCETFGWHPSQIPDTPSDFYQATLTILSLRNARDNRKPINSPSNHGSRK